MTHHIKQQSNVTLNMYGVRKQSKNEYALTKSSLAESWLFVRFNISSFTAELSRSPLNAATFLQLEEAMFPRLCKQHQLKDSGANLANENVYYANIRVNATTRSAPPKLRNDPHQMRRMAIVLYEDRKIWIRCQLWSWEAKTANTSVPNVYCISAIAASNPRCFGGIHSTSNT